MALPTHMCMQLYPTEQQNQDTLHRWERVWIWSSVAGLALHDNFESPAMVDIGVDDHQSTTNGHAKDYHNACHCCSYIVYQPQASATKLSQNSMQE